MSIITAVEALPTEGLTIQALGILDNIVPGEWQNTTSFDQLLIDASGESHVQVLSALRTRATAIEQADGNRYARALQVYQLVDSLDQAAAGAAVASKLGSAFGSFFGTNPLESFTPKPETTQAIDAGVKLVGEMIAFGLINGMPTAGDSGVARFVGALEDYARYDLIRIAAWVTFDGIIPLGPDFLGKIMSTFKSAAGSDLASNGLFKQLGAQIPGSSSEDKQAFILDAVDKTSDFMSRFVQSNGITQEKVMAQVQQVLGVGGDSMDYVAAAIDASTNYMAHTGTQTVGRALAKRATDQLKQEVWAQWVAEQAS